ncbi:3-oxoacyl-ACP synthase III family protein [Candidatus Pseudothioglobus sp. Uisw_050_01]|uniref:3-oxoacyl-ACP synthase III family protein n=1 Tax=Candidatus Pseudothioglobus sp. Uisw_050_01 TaxID=3230997 RepID=UPI003A84EB00
MRSFIKKIEYYIPSNRTNVIDLDDAHKDWDIENSIKKTGVKVLHHADKDETIVDMAYIAASKVLSKMSSDEIPDTLIFCTQTPDFTIPHCSALLQDKLKLPTSTKCFDISLGCSGYSYGLSIAYSMLKSDLSHSVFLISGDAYSKIINENDKTSYLLFSDAVACSLLERPKENLPFLFGTDGAGFKNIIYPMSGINTTIKNSNMPNCSINDNGRFEMQGAAVYLFTMSVIVDEIKTFMKENELSFNDIDLVVLHQASLLVLKTIQAKLNIPDHKMLIDLEEIGNTGSASIPIALKRAEDKKLLKRGNRLLLFGFGIGLSWSGSILRY